MDSSPPLRRSKSLKRVLTSRSRRDSVLNATEDLPAVALGNTTIIRANKAFDDAALKPTLRTPPSVPRPLTARSTWPQGMRESKPGSRAFERTPTLVKTPWELDRSLRSAPRSSASTGRSSISGTTLGRLPREILHCILDHLYGAHMDGSQIDVANYRNDVRSLCVANKQWHRVAREHLYREIWLPWSPAPMSTREHQALLGIRSNDGLRLLLRTLEESPGLARLVKRLCVPSAPGAGFEDEDYAGPKHSRSMWLQSGAEAIRQIIYACPNLRSFGGNYLVACDRTDGLFTALLSRPKLEEHVWKLTRRTNNWQRLRPNPNAFVELHFSMPHLKTLILWGQNWNSIDLGSGTVSAVLQRLPMLRHLMVKDLPIADFHNGTLLMLGPLKSLRLESLPGVTEHGLQQLVHTRLALSLERLCLFDMPVMSLRTVQALLESLPRLRKLSLILVNEPTLQQGFDFAGTSFSLSSPTLEHLYWHTFTARSNISPAILANGIAAGRFPKLRSVRIPSDDGAVQRLCRPIRRRSLDDAELKWHLRERYGNGSYPGTAACTEIEAQLRAKEAQKEQVFEVTVEDEKGVEQLHWAGAYLGSITSKIEYRLDSAIPGQKYCCPLIGHLAEPEGLKRGWQQAAGLDVLF